MNRIEKLAEERYKFISDESDQHSRPKFTFNGNQEERRKAFIAGALSEQARAHKLVEAQKEYIELLEMVYNSASVFCAVHGVFESDEIIKQGKQLREKIKQTLTDYEGEEG